VVPISENNNVNTVNDAPPKYSPPPSYGKAMGLRVAAKVLRNSIRRSVRRFRRSEQPAEANTNIPTISSAVETRPDGQARTSNFGQSFNEFIRSSIRRVARSSQSSEQLVLSDITTDYHVV
jgi:hypothetical protein